MLYYWVTYPAQDAILCADRIQGNSCLWRFDHGTAQRCFYLVMRLVKIIFSWIFLFSLVLMFGFQSYQSVPLLSFRLSWLYLRVCLEVLAQEHSHFWPNTGPLPFMEGRSLMESTAWSCEDRQDTHPATQVSWVSPVFLPSWLPWLL